MRVNGGDVDAEEGSKGGYRAVCRERVSSDIVGNVCCKGWERGDKGLGKQQICLIDRHGVVIDKFGDIQFEFDCVSVEIFD